MILKDKQGGREMHNMDKTIGFFSLPVPVCFVFVCGSVRIFD